MTQDRPFRANPLTACLVGVALAEEALADSRKVEAERVRNPIDALRYQRQLLENLRLLEAINQELLSAQVDLANLVNAPLGQTIPIAEADVPVTPDHVVKLPVQTLEEVALRHNADLREAHYNARIARDETHKVMARMFPNLSFNYSLNYDSDKFLVDRNWQEAGLQLSFNFMNLLTGPAQKKLAEAGVALADQRRVATQMAVLTQVHLTRLQLLNARSQFKRSEEMYATDRRISELGRLRESAQLVMGPDGTYTYSVNNSHPDVNALGSNATLTWLYRLVLFIGIALMVYHLFFQLLGIVLFVIEIVWFILKPVQSEWRAWRERAGAIRASRRTRRTLLGLGLGLLLMTVPWPLSVSASALLRPMNVWPIHAPAGAYLAQLPVAHGSRVSAGQTLVHLASPALGARVRAALARVERLRRQAGTAAFAEESRQQWLSMHESLVTAESELDALHAETRRLTPVAPWPGVVLDLDPDLQPGQWVARDERLAILVQENSSWMVETWLDEDDVARIQVGAKARFHRDSGIGGTVALKVSAIDKDTSRVLARPELAAVNGGHVLVRHSNQQLVPERAIYRVQLEVIGAPADVGDASQSWRGRVAIEANSQAMAARYVRQLLMVLVRELGF